MHVDLFYKDCQLLSHYKYYSFKLILYTPFLSKSKRRFFVFWVAYHSLLETKTMGGSSPCASCKLLRRRCAKDCIFAPYFPSDDPHKFAMVHKVFGASNVSKMLQELPVHQRADAVSSLVYEANARVRDPVYGCVGAISILQNQVSQLQMQLAVAQAEILCIQMQQEPASLPITTNQMDHHQNDKSFLLSCNNLDSNINIPGQYLGFTSSSSNSIQDPALKRESLWT